MSKREIIILAFKIIAIIVVIQSLFLITTLLAQTITMFGKLNSGVGVDLDSILSVLPYLVGFMLYFGLGIHLWTMAGSYADRMSRDFPSFKEDKKVVPEDIKEIAFSAVGIYVIASSIPQIVQLILQLIDYLPTAPLRNFPRSNYIFANLISTIIKLGIGFWLLLGSRGIINTIDKLRRERSFTEQPPE